MPAAKDHKLLKGHWTKEQKEQKAKQKASVTPCTKLEPPQSIKSNIGYYSIWKSVLAKYKGTELLNALDADILARYCIEKSGLSKLYSIRDAMLKKGEFNVEVFLKLETRIEGKIKTLNQMATSLYMNPRARAGAVPQQPDKEPKDDPNAALFD